MPEAGDVFQAAMEFETQDSGKMMNIYDLLVQTGSCTDAELLTAIGSWVTTAYTTLLSKISDTVSAQTCKVNKMVWTGTKWVVERYVGQVIPSLTFTNANQALPHATSPLVQFLTSWPRVVGKKYIPVVGEDLQNGSFLEGTLLTAMLAFCAAIQTHLTPGTADIKYVIRRKTGTTTGPYAYSANGTISSQRRRKPGVGE